MKSARLTKSLFRLLFVLMALVMGVSAAAPLASARSLSTDKVDRKVSAAVDTFISNLPQNGYGYIEATDLNALLDTADSPFVLDVRPPDQFAAGHVRTAVNIQLDYLLANLDKLPAKDKAIVAYCGIGHNGAIAMVSLTMLGYKNVRSVGGGFYFWDQIYHLPVEK